AGDRETMRQYIGSSGATKTIPPLPNRFLRAGHNRPIIRLGTLRFYHGAREVSTKTCAGWQRLGTGKRRPRDGQPSARPRPPRDLLDLDRSAGLFQLLLDLLGRSEEHTSELQSRATLACRLLLEKTKSPTRAGS